MDKRNTKIAQGFCLSLRSYLGIPIQNRMESLEAGQYRAFFYFRAIFNVLMWNSLLRRLLH